LVRCQYFPLNEFYLVDFTIGIQRLLELPANVRMEHPTLSEDGALVAFVNLLDKHLYVMSTTEFQPWRLVVMEEGFTVWLPTFKPDGSELALVAMSPDKLDEPSDPSLLLRVGVDRRDVAMRDQSIVVEDGIRGIPQQLWWEGEKIRWTYDSVGIHSPRSFE
jgi:hypothetical protein